MKLSIRQPARLACLAVLIAAGAMLLSASGAQAASKRGAVLVKDIAPSHPKRFSSSSPSELTNVAGTLFFAASDRRHGGELWRSDGTRRGTRMVKDINPRLRPCAASKGACRGQGASSLPSLLTASGRTLYFTADDGVHGVELWRSDGTSRGTRMVKDITPGTGSPFLGVSRELTDVAGVLFFVVGDSVNSQLWRSDGTETGTIMLKQVPNYASVTAVGRTAYFSAGGGLWRSDGTASGTVLVKEFKGIGECPCSLTDVAGTLFFIADHGTQYFALWRSDGTETGTTVVKDGVAPNDRTVVGGTLYFTTGDPRDSWLWRSDGTEAGTTPITSVGPTPEGDGLWPELTNVGGTLYFVRNAGFFGATLLRTDGTPSGTTELRSHIIPRQLTSVGHTLYFEGFDNKHGNELWQSDGTSTGTRLVRDIRRGDRSSRLRNLTAVGKTLYFSARDARHGTELWRAGAKPCKKAKGKCKKG